MHKGVDLLILCGDERPKGANKGGNIEPHAIGFGLDNTLEKMIKNISIIHLPMCLQ